MKLAGIAVSLIVCVLMTSRAWAETSHETHSAQYQATWNWQWHPGFHSTVQSRNSLGSEAARMYTLSLTAHWGSWTYAAWDYAADARGFGWGAAVEIIRDDWALRFGRMTVPREPNGLSIDTRVLRHYGDQIEIERSIELIGNLPGKLRLLAYRNKGVLASFDDARKALPDTPSADPQTLDSVRYGPRIKHGVGVNIEQATGRGLGVFFRGMRSDGRSETQAFTEVDRSLAAGLAADGTRWNRTGDSAGIALMSNSLSAQRRRYLEAGGISFFIGDGRIVFRPEVILEAFYSWNMRPGFWLTSGYQHIRHPAYNAMRGPVDVLAFRIHTRF